MKILKERGDYLENQRDYAKSKIDYATQKASSDNKELKILVLISLLFIFVGLFINNNVIIGLSFIMIIFGLILIAYNGLPDIKSHEKKISDYNKGIVGENKVY